MNARALVLSGLLGLSSLAVASSAQAAGAKAGGASSGRTSGGGGSSGNWELEPHLNLAPYYGCLGGLGGRATVKLADHVSRAGNDSLGFTFGFDGLSCHVGPTSGDFVAPVGVLWNFNLSPDWSVFADGGLMVPGPALYLMAGGRYKVGNNVALTGRVGFPFVSFGVSFFL